VHLRPNRQEATPQDVGDDDRGPRRRRRRGRIIAVLALVVVTAGVVLAVLARPLVEAKHEADAAQEDLKLAKTQLSEQHLADARTSIAAARSHVDAAHRAAHGFGADVWSAVPVAGGAVDDERHLVDALAETTSVAELGADVYPMVSGHDSGMINGQAIDMKVLQTVVDRVGRIGDHLDRAMADIEAVKGSTPIVGGAATRAKDSALTYLQPVHDSYAKAGPLVASLPSIVGADGPRTYLIAMLNPAEQRYSGGGALSFTTMRFDHGQVTFGKSVNVDDLRSRGTTQRWRPVHGNPFHPRGPLRVTSATFSPWWSVSSEELLRGYEATYPGTKLDGVIGLDLQALADVFRVTGPVDLPHFGTVTADNLVHTLAGSYGDFASIEVRHQLNKELIPAFRQKFFEGGRMADKLTALVDSADGRHFFTYFRQGNIQRPFVRLGLSGDLAHTGNDYIGVFTQNLNGSKVDYWQRRSVASTVRLHADGSAAVHLRVDVTNGAPAYTLSTPDPQVGYDTRYLNTLIGVFLPRFAQLGTVSADGTPFTPAIRHPNTPHVLNRRYFQHPFLLGSGESGRLDADYTVPKAAVQDSDTAMTYVLDVDPQDLVYPEALKVTVTFPNGWTSTSLPHGWQATSTGARWAGHVPTKMHVEIPLEKTSAQS
jgi:hypothetical protein